MVIEPALAHRSRTTLECRLEKRKVARQREGRGVVRMHAGGEEDEKWVGTREFACTRGGGEGFTDAHDCSRTCAARPRDDSGAVIVECLIGQVRVTIDEISHQKVKTAVE